MTSFILSTVVFFIVAFLIRRYLDDMRIEATLGRSIVIFVIALGAAYGFAALVDWLV